MAFTSAPSQPRFFYPDHDSEQEREWPGGVEDPRLVEREDGTYVLAYTQWNRRSTDIGIATSTDLIHWRKEGPALVGEKYQHFSYKSASIVTRLTNGRLLAAKLHGKYWMYWGEKEVRLATSDDLIHWTPVEDSSGKAIVLLRRRPGRFDSAFPEVGPPSLVTDRVFCSSTTERTLRWVGRLASPPTRTPTDRRCSQRRILEKLIARTQQPFFKPEEPWEQNGQYAAGTTFAEGLVFFPRSVVALLRVRRLARRGRGRTHTIAGFSGS